MEEVDNHISFFTRLVLSGVLFPVMNLNPFLGLGDCGEVVAVGIGGLHIDSASSGCFDDSSSV